MQSADTFMRLDEDRYYGTKVPEITPSFWVAKILSTAMGEATSDFLVFHTNTYLAVTAGGIGFLAALVLQFSVRRHIPAIYWLVVIMVSIFGTMIADVIHVVLGVPYIASTSLFAAGLILILWRWNATETTLSIHTVATPRREAFYWATVVATFALGTAAGDLTASTFGLGYLTSALLFSTLFALPALAYFVFGLNDVAAFWTAYILTRPMGASFADWFDKPVASSGLGYGTPAVAALLSGAVGFAVLFICLRHQPQTVPAS
ncbi:COG4705 family protein [Acidiphilium sp.]|uniref:COG4705 family protein n=1 Tax=Acidiphilium sp. TaxID=527 RepID=UPI003D060E20